TIPTFNSQIVGEAKRSKPQVMDVLAKTARNFDLMVIQELRDDTETTLPIYLEKINSLPGPKYSSISSPRLGRTASKENYAFIFNTEKIQLINGSNYTFTDLPNGTSEDLFQREPFVAEFKSGKFDFVLITIHTDPGETPQELGDLPLVLSDAQARFPDEKDFIMLGDMNADCSYLKQSDNISLRNSSYTWIVPDSADTTTKSTDCTYDRIIILDPSKEDYLGSWGIFRFDQAYGINQSLTEEVSDHYPVWSVFSTANDSD